MNNKKTKDYFFVGTVIFLCLVLIGVSYAYFKLQIEGTGKDIVMDTGDLRLRYTDGAEITLNNAFPGDTVTKKVTVENIGTKDVKYSLYWDNLLNEILRNELTLKMECKSYKNYGESIQEESGLCDDIEKVVPLAYDRIDSNIKTNISIGAGITHEYKITVTFFDAKMLQNYNKNKSFEGNIGVKEYNENTQAVINCSTGQTSLTQGGAYENGQYTYHYMQHHVFEGDGSISSSPDWIDSDIEGWGVILTDKDDTDAITSQMCTYIDNKPVVFYDYLFFKSQTTSIDLSSFNTGNVLSMNGMFTAINIQDGLLDFSKFDTSKVQTMHEMFAGSNFGILDVSNFDTSNVTDMSSMFNGVSATEIKGLKKFDTSNVITMSDMFVASNIANPINTRNFNTSNVIDMSEMFYFNNFTSVDVGSFDTYKVKNMSKMFGSFMESNVMSEIKGIENFDTSNVIDMSEMFSRCNVTSLNLSKWDTSKVNNMHSMFSNSAVTSLNLDGFNTKSVTDMSYMFYNVKVETLDVSSFDTSKVTDMNYMFGTNTKLITIYASGKFVVDNVTNGKNMFTNSSNLVGGNGTKYDSSKVDKTYALIDTAETPGYFTLKGN